MANNNTQFANACNRENTSDQTSSYEGTVENS